MHTLSYKHYLHLLEKRPKLTKIQKLAIFLLSLILMISGMTSAVIWQYQNEKPLRSQRQYLEVASGGFMATSESLAQILVTFQVLGTKTKAIDQLKEASTSASEFFVPLDDLTKSIAMLKSTQKNIAFQKNLLQDLATPQKFADLNNQLISFYDESIEVATVFQGQQKYLKDLLLALGPNFYLPTVSNEYLWKKGQISEIKNYYQNLKNEADLALANLAHLETPSQFQNYHQTQIAYLDLAVKTATSIINLLSEEQSTEITQLEKAYQALTAAKRENDQIAEKLLAQRLQFLSTKENLNKLAVVKIRQNSLKTRLTEAINSQPEAKIKLTIPQWIKKILSVV